MRKQIFAGIVWVTFFILSPSFCMENVPDHMENKQKSVVEQVLSNPELSIKILGYLSFRRPLYSYSLIAESLALNKPLGLHEPLELYEMFDSFVTNTPPHLTLYPEDIWSSLLNGYDFSREKCSSRALKKEFISIILMNQSDMKQHLNMLDHLIINSQHLFFEGQQGLKITQKQGDIQQFLNIALMDSQDPSVRDPKGLKFTQLVSKQFCDFSRFNITSITSPTWADDNDLREYSATLPKLTALRMMYCNGLTNDGLKQLTNLTSLDLENKLNITDDGLIDKSGQPRHPKLKLLLLSREHKITEDAFRILESHGVEIKENDYF